MPTPAPTEASALYFTAPRRVEVRAEPLADPAEGEVLLETIASGISAGTEMNVYRGVAPQWRRRRDPATGLFVEADEPEWSYPSRYGYASVGRVAALGPGVTDRSPDQLVFAYAPHGSHASVPAAATVPLGSVAPETGVLYANLNTALNGVLDARPPLGADLVVSGLGVIGQLVVRLLARTGPRCLVAVDPVPMRRELAARGGATHTMAPDGNVAERVRELTDARGADVVLEVSGAPPALNEAIRTAGYNGLVVAMSWYGGTFETLDLSAEFHHNRPRIVSSQVGAVNPELGPLWSVARRGALARRYLEELDLAPLVSHRIPFARAAEAYAHLDDRPEDAMQIVLTYGSDA